MAKTDDDFEIGDLVRIWDEVFIQFLETLLPMHKCVLHENHDKIGIFGGAAASGDCLYLIPDYEETYSWIYIEGEKKLVHDSFLMKIQS